MFDFSYLVYNDSGAFLDKPNVLKHTMDVDTKHVNH